MADIKNEEKIVSITDKNGNKWEVKYTLRSLKKMFRSMGCSLAQLTNMELPVADLLDSLTIVCEKQYKERGMSKDSFEELIDDIPMGVVIAAITEGIQKSFPSDDDQTTKKAKGGDAPFDHGSGMTS